MILYYILSPLIFGFMLFLFPLLPLMIMMKKDKEINIERINIDKFKRDFLYPCIFYAILAYAIQLFFNFVMVLPANSLYFGLAVIMILPFPAAVATLIDYDFLGEKFFDWKKKIKYILLVVLGIIFIVVGFVNGLWEYKDDSLIEGIEELPDITKQEVSSMYNQTVRGPFYSNEQVFFYIPDKAVIEYNDDQLKTVPINHKIRYMDIRNAYPNYNYTIMDDYVYYNEVLYTKVTLTKGIFKGFKFQKLLLINMKTGEYLEYTKLPDFAK